MNAGDKAVQQAGGKVLTVVRRRKSGQVFVRVRFGDMFVQRTGSNRTEALHKAVEAYRESR